MLHREDIKATIRKRYGSLLKFERAKGLPAHSVKDVLRGRAIWQARREIALELGMPAEKLFTIKRSPRSSTKVDDKPDAPVSHRLNRRAA
jgi:lambda repressor-like predicted transcriptional regulator